MTETAARQPVIIKERKPRNGTFVPQPQFQGPPIPIEVEKMRRLSARERVELGYHMLKQYHTARGTAAFKSQIPRDPYDLHEERITTQQQLLKREIEERRHKELEATVHARSPSQPQPTRGRTPDPQYSAQRKRSSSWARDTTPRGTYLYNWTHMPQCVPRRHIDPTPGPGAYTPALYFVGGGST